MNDHFVSDLRSQLEERKEQIQSTWEDVTKMVRKTEVHKDELRERADGELERTGQPLCIYEPYHGRGAWPFLHQETTLYRGLSIVSIYDLLLALLLSFHGWHSLNE